MTNDEPTRSDHRGRATTPRRAAALLCSGLLLAACGGSEDDSGSTPASDVATTSAGSEPPRTTTTEPPPTQPPDTEPPDTEPPSTEPPVTEADDPLVGAELLGRWAHYDVVAYEDDVMKTLIISYGYDDFAEVDGRIVGTTRFCSSEQRTDQPIEITLSDAATQAIVPPPTPIDVEVVDGQLRIRRAATPTPVGIRLDDPATEALPDDPDDPRIVDDDGDGKPGITVGIRVGDDLTGELYIARREIFAYEAVLTGPDRIEGSVTDDSEQLVIGASDPIFAGSGGEWVQHPDLSESPIILQRVDDDFECDRLAAERDDLFPPAPDIDW